MVSSFLTLPLALVPASATAVGVGVVLNLFFRRHPELKERLAELAGKILCFEVHDLDRTFYMLVDSDGNIQLHPHSDTVPHVTMSGDAAAFLALLFQTQDPDTLFFNRQLTLSGETDTGLLFKNILGNVDIDWEEELALFIPRSVVRRLLQLAEQAKDRKEQFKEQLDELSVDFLEERKIPRQPGLESLRIEVVDLSEQVQKLERRIDRLINRMGIAAAARSPRDKSTTSGS